MSLQMRTQTGQALPQRQKWRVARMYRTIDELYSAPNLPLLPRPIQSRADVNTGQEVPVIDGLVRQLAEPYVHVLPKVSMWQCERGYRTIDELYKAPNFTMPRPVHPMSKTNEPSVSMIPTSSSATQGYQLSQLNTMLMAIDLGKSSIGSPKEVAEMSALSSMVFPMQNELYNAPRVPSPTPLSPVSEQNEVNDAPTCDSLHLVQESPVGERNNFDLIEPDDIVCSQCLCGDKEEELVLCDSCTLGYHTFCARPILPCVPVGPWKCSKCSGPRQVSSLSEQDIINFFKIQHFNSEDHTFGVKLIGKKRKRCKSTPWTYRNRKQWLPYVPSKEKSKRLEQLDSLARALQSLNLEFANDLVYVPNMDDPRCTNLAALDKSEVQILRKGNAEIWDLCKAMHRRGECPPLKVVYDNEQGYMVIADEPIEDKTFICEFTGLVDFSKNREVDDSNCLMNLLVTNDEYKDLVICQDKYGNVSHFLSGINNHKKESKKRQNCTFIRCSVDGQCRIFIVSTRRIKAGTALYCNYNAGVSVNSYPTQNFV